MSRVIRKSYVMGHYLELMPALEKMAMNSGKEIEILAIDLSDFSHQKQEPEESISIKCEFNNHLWLISMWNSYIEVGEQVHFCITHDPWNSQYHQFKYYSLSQLASANFMDVLNEPRHKRR